MRPVLLLLALVACGGSSGDLCTRAVNASDSIASELNSCADGDAGIARASAAIEIAACKTAIASCTAADQKVLETEVSCLAALPPFLCKWDKEETAGIVDGGLVQWSAEVGACELTQQLSAGCPGLGPLTPEPCGVSVCAPPAACVSLGMCGPHCGCVTDSNCAPTQRCGPSFDCGGACFSGNL